MRVLGGASLLLGSLGACGGDDSEGVTTSPPEETTTSEGEAAPGTCDGTDLTYTSVSTGETVDLSSSTAVSLSDGAAYTAYAADFELGPDDVSIVNGPEAPADGTMATISVTIFNAEGTPPPIEVGTVVEHDTSEFGILTFVVVVNEGPEALGNNEGGEGEVTITSVGDRFCAEVRYADAEKELAGTLEAAVKEL